MVDADLQIHPLLLEWSKKYIHEMQDKEINENLKVIYDKKIRLQDYEDKNKKAQKQFIESKISENERDEYVSDLKVEYSDVLDVNASKKINWVEKLNEILDLTQSIKETLMLGTFDAKRNQLTKLGANITWNDKELIIDNKKSIKLLINGLKLVSPYFQEFGKQKALVEQGLSDETSDVCLIMRKW